MTHTPTISTLDAARSVCPKRMHNGPCGGVRPGGMCEADAALACPYLNIYDELPWRLRSPLEARPRAAQARGKLVDQLRAGKWVIVAEAYPPDGVETSALIERFAALRQYVDAVNVPDNPLATPHLSALATATLFQRSGISAIMNLSCRDRNRIALQSELLAAAALGVENIFCITGDHPKLGDHRHAQSVFELDSFELIALARQMRDEGVFENGEPLVSRPHFLIGAVGNVCNPPVDWQAERTAAKVAAGANFIQTHPISDLKVFRDYMRRMGDLGALERAWLIAGVVVVTTLEQALWLRTEVPLPLVSDDFIALLHHAKPERQRAEALAYTADLIAEIRATPGVNGVLLFPLGRDVETVGELAEAAELNPADPAD